MMSQARVIQDMTRLNAALRGSNVSMPISMTDRIVQATYSKEQNFPMMGGDWLFSLEALALVGKAMFGNEWSGTEFDALDWQQSPVEQHKWELAQQRRNVEARKYVHLPSSLASSDYVTPEAKAAFDARKEADLQSLSNSALELPLSVSALQSQWEANGAALSRLTNAAKWLGDKCRSADIKTGYGSAVNLPMLSGDSVSWNCINDLQHWVKDGSIEIFMVSAGKMCRCKAYVSRADLAREIKTLAYSESNVPKTDIARLSPDLQLALRLALKHQLFDAGMQQSNGELEKAVISAAKEEGREIADNRVKEMVRLMRYPDKVKSDAGKKRTGK